jgi:polyhydroxybutyrate depolymerase
MPKFDSKKTALYALIICMFASMNTPAEIGNLRERWRGKKEASQQANQALTAGDYTFSIKHQNINRIYMVHVPKSYQAVKSMPMVLSLHGGGGNMRYQADDEYYGLISKSESAGFIAVFPNGYSRFTKGSLATWNAGICCGKARDKNIDDVGFIKSVVNDMKVRANIDVNRIYANGMSNGGMMSYRLACEMPDTFKAIVSVAGTDGTIDCTPSKPVSVLHIHALDDERVLYHGGSGSDSNTHADFESVPNTIAKWVKLNSCSATPVRVLQVSGAYCDIYKQCQNGTQVKVCITDTGGHSWPGGKKYVRAHPLQPLLMPQI